MNGTETKHMKAFRETKLKPGEVVLAQLEGWIGEAMGTGDKAPQNGHLILTAGRACFYRKGLSGEHFETIPISKITAVETSARMNYRIVRMQAPDAQLEFKTSELKPAFDAVIGKLEQQRDAAHHQSANPMHKKDEPVHAEPTATEPGSSTIMPPTAVSAILSRFSNAPAATAQVAAPPVHTSAVSGEAKEAAAAPPPAEFIVSCACGARIKACARHIGITVACPKCKTPIVIHA